MRPLAFFRNDDAMVEALADADMIMCDECERWPHRTCAGMDERTFRVHKRHGDVPFFCEPCSEKLRLEELEGEQLGGTSSSSGDAFLDAFPQPIPYDGKPEAEQYCQFTGLVFWKWCNNVLLKPLIDQGCKPNSLATQNGVQVSTEEVCYISRWS
jgi:hypothetical protein